MGYAELLPHGGNMATPIGTIDYAAVVTAPEKKVEN